MKTRVKKTLLLLLTAGLLFSPHLSFAQKTERHPILQKFETEGAKVEFLGNAYGMDGWVVIHPKGGVQYVYVTPEGGLLIGMLFAPDGALETMKQVRAYKERAEGVQTATPGADKSSLKSEKLYAEAEKSGWVAIGDKSAPYMYIFINVSCDSCQKFLKELDNAVKAGKLQLRLVPYGAVEINRDGAAALLSAEDPYESWQAYVSGDRAALDKNKIKGDAYAKIDANTDMVRNWKLAGPPFTLYRRPADGIITAVIGQPDNIMLLQAEFLK